MKKAVLIIFSLLNCLSLFPQHTYRIEYSDDCLNKNVYNDKNEIVYVLNCEQTRWKSEIVKNVLFYLNINNELVAVNLDNGKNILALKNVGDFGVSDDLKYICIGKISEELNDSIYTTIPELFDFQKRKYLKTENFDYSILKSDIGMNTDIRYESEKNGFTIAYNWDTPVPQYSFFLSLYDYKIIQTK